MAELAERLERVLPRGLQDLASGASGFLNCEGRGFCWLQPHRARDLVVPPRKLIRRGETQRMLPSKHGDGESPTGGSVLGENSQMWGILVFFTLGGAAMGPSGTGSWGRV